MTRILQRAAVVLLMLAVVAGAVAPDAHAKKKWEKIEIPSLGVVEMPDYERVELDNGMVLFLAEDHEFPLVELSATIQAGSIYEPAAKVGLASMTGSVLRTGGTEKMTGDEIDALVEDRGMRVNTWVGDTSGGAYLSVLAEDTELGLDLLSDILMAPVFDEDRIVIAKEEQKASISRRNDEPMTIVRREAVKVLFGPDHPMARYPEYDTVASVTREDMIDFHRQWFGPDRVRLVVIGDFDRQAMVGMIEAAFAGWAPAAAPLPPDPEIPDLPRTVNMVDKEDLTQSTIVLGHKGIRNDDPNYAALTVANRILGGGFGDRLFNEVRSKRGLAYSVGSVAGTGWRFPGTFMAFTMTKNSTAEAATDVILEEIERMTVEPVTEVELQQAKDGILAADVFSYDTKREVLDRLVLFEMNGYPADFLQQYQHAVATMTTDDVLSAAQAVWKPERLSVFALGNPAEWDGDLSKYGPVNEIDITIPEPSLDMNIPLATPQSLEQGKSAMQGVLAKSGGTKIKDLDAYYEETEIEAEIQGMPMKFTMQKTVVFPDRMHLVTKTPFGEMKQVVAGDIGWSVSPMGAKDLAGEDLQKARDEIDSDMVALLRDLDRYQCQALDPAQVDGVACLPVYVTRGGDAEDYQIVFVDQETGLVRMIQSKGESPMTGSPVTQKVYVDEYQDTNGFTMPKALRIMHDDEQFATAQVKEFRPNEKAKEELFEKQ